MLNIKDTLSGAFGSICLTYAGLPFDVTKVRMQTSHTPGMRISTTMVQIFRKEGLFSFWRGAGPALVSALMENSVVFTANGAITRLFAGGKHESELTLFEHAVIGGMSGFFSSVSICPAEVVKCRMQAQSAASAAISGVPKFANGFECGKYIFRNEGVRGFYAGLLPLLMRDIPFNTLFFGAYRAYSRLLRWAFDVPKHDEIPGWQAFLSGGFGGMTAWAIVYPFDALKSRIQAGSVYAPGQKSSSQGRPSILTAFRGVMAEGGVRMLYQGCSAAVLRGFPANAALFWGVETMSSLLRNVNID